MRLAILFLAVALLSGCPKPPPTTTPLSVQTASVSEAEIGVPYGAQLHAQGGVTPYHWAVIGGSLPGGLVLLESGFLTGTPTETGVFVFTVRVNDSQIQTAKITIKGKIIEAN